MNKFTKKDLVEMVRRIIKEETMDSDAVRELILFSENDHRLYDILHKTYVPALLKFKKKGTFDRNKAIKLMEYYYQNYVRPSYKKEYGADIKLSPIERKSFAEYFIDTLEQEGYLNI